MYRDEGAEGGKQEYGKRIFEKEMCGRLEAERKRATCQRGEIYLEGKREDYSERGLKEEAERAGQFAEGAEKGRAWRECAREEKREEERTEAAVCCRPAR